MDYRMDEKRLHPTWNMKASIQWLIQFPCWKSFFVVVVPFLSRKNLSSWYVYALWMKLTCIFQMQTKRSSNVESENSLTSFENHQFDETKSGFDLLPYANSVYEKRLAQIKRGSGEGGDFIRCFFLLIHRFRQSRWKE